MSAAPARAWQIRRAVTVDIPQMQRVEVAAGALFLEVGMEEVAHFDPPTTDELAPALVAGTVWVAQVVGSGDGGIVAYLWAFPADGRLHVEQLSVDPEHGRQGIGRDLLDHAAYEAGHRGLGGLSLTTFRDVPWNARYYRRLGFHELPADKWGPDMVQIREAERVHGLDLQERCVMVRP